MNEIHVTVAAPHSSFAEWAAVKFPTPNDHPHRGWSFKVHQFVNYALPDPITDVFSSEVCSGSIDRAIVVGENRFSQIKSAGLSPVRLKIEREPWDQQTVTGGEYYESHLALLGVPPSSHRLGVKNMLLSTNVRKRSVTGTLRSRECTLEQHMDRLNKMVRGLLANRVAVVGAHHEFVALDTNPEHDRLWEQSSG